MDRKYILKFINTDFFEFPIKPLMAKIKSFKYGIVANSIEFINPTLIICNKSSSLDRLFVSNIITSDFVFLKDEYVKKIYEGTITDNEKKLLIKSIKRLKEAFISIAIFPEKSYTIFGRCDILPEEITEFLFETTYDIKYLNIIGSYYTYPVWSKEPRRYEIKFTQQFSLSHRKLNNFNPTERNEIINHYMPSSATMYAIKYPALIRSRNRAENFESIMYLCPNCNKMFTLYSEFNCLKCKECGTALEFSIDGAILLSSKINTLDQLEDFMFDNLKRRSFSLKELVSYPDVTIVKKYGKKELISNGYSFTIYADRFTLSKGQYSRSINLSEVTSIDLDYNNTIFIKLKNEVLIIRGEHKENFYILIDLNKINKS